MSNTGPKIVRSFWQEYEITVKRKRLVYILSCPVCGQEFSCSKKEIDVGRKYCSQKCAREVANKIGGWNRPF